MLDGAGIVEILRLTGYKSYTDFMSNTTLYERQFLAAAISQWHEERDPPLGGGL